LADLQDRYLRVAADFDNFKKRAQRERTDLLKFANEHLAKQLLEGIDNLERARAHAETADKESLLQGVGLVESIFLQTLERFGIRRFSAMGQGFDPAFHEAVQEVTSPDAAPGAVLFELQKGYTYHDRLLRPARVVLSKGPSTATVGTAEAPREPVAASGGAEPTAERSQSLEGPPGEPGGGSAGGTSQS
jgi:molecular chaperone GrpE